MGRNEVFLTLLAVESPAKIRTIVARDVTAEGYRDLCHLANTIPPAEITKVISATSVIL